MRARRVSISHSEDIVKSAPERLVVVFRLQALHRPLSATFIPFLAPVRYWIPWNGSSICCSEGRAGGRYDSQSRGRG